MKSNEAKQNLYSIQCLRGIAALLVVSCHIAAIETLYMSQSPLPSWGKYGVDLFFVISGFVISYTTHEQWGKASAALPFLLKRMLRIYPIYLQFTLVVLAVLFLSPSVIKSGAADKASILKSLLLWPQRMDPVLGVGWSLVYELYFYLIFAVVFFIPRRMAAIALVGWCAALVTALFSRSFEGSNAPEIWVITSPLCFEFMAGCMVAALFRRGIKANPLLLLTLAVLWAVIMHNRFDAESSFLMRVIVWGLPSTLCVYAALLLEQTSVHLFPKWLRSIGDASFSLYLSHSLIISAMGKIWQRLHFQGMAGHASFILVCLVSTTGLALANYRFVEKPLSRTYHNIAKKIANKRLDTH